MNSTQVQQLFREHYHNYGINTGIVLLSPGDYKRTYEGTGGKLAEGWDANTGLRASCPNFQPKNDVPKVRHDFHFLAPCV